MLRIGGPSTGADEMVAVAQSKGKIIFTDFQQIPEVKNATPDNLFV